MRHAPLRRAMLALALGVGLAACQAAPGPAPAPGGKPRASKAPAVVKASEPVLAPSTAPAASEPPAAPSAAPATLLKPSTPTRTLSGTVRIDAAYAVGTSGARLIANNGGTAVQAAGSLVANNSGNLIANNGGTLVGNNGGTLVSDRGGAYALAQAPDAPPALGTILPAAGLVLTARALRTGEPVSLGVDARGTPVTAVYTNAAGAFELYVPAAVERLVFEARFPGEAGADRRLAYDVLPADPEGAVVIDEDTAQVTRYVRDACRGTVAKFMLTDDVDHTLSEVVTDAADELIPPLTALIKEFRAVSAEVGLDQAPAADITRVAGRMTDVILANVDLGGVRLTKAYWPDWQGPEEPAIPALVDIMKRIREASTTKLTQDPAFFAAQPYLAGANASLPAGQAPYVIRKPADLNDFIVQAFVIPNKKHVETEAIFESIGIEAYQTERLYAAVNNYIGVIAMALFADADGGKTEALAVLRAYRKP